jgi:hypothetical protein
MWGEFVPLSHLVKMHKSLPMPTEAARLELAALLGQSQAFGSMAGRCSAAQAAALHHIRHAAQFKGITSRWREFCWLHLGLDGRHADRIIRFWEEFGAPYFELAQLTHVPPDTYRALAPFIHDGALHLDSETIELRPENSRRLAAAIARFPRPAPPPKRQRSLAPHEQLAALDKRAVVLIAQLRRFSTRERCGENWLQLTSILTRLTAALQRLNQENGLH